MPGSKKPASPRTPARALTEGFARRSNPSVTGSSEFFTGGLPIRTRGPHEHPTVAAFADSDSSEDERRSGRTPRPAPATLPRSQADQTTETTESTIPPPYNRGAVPHPNPVVFACRISQNASTAPSQVDIIAHQNILLWIPISTLPTDFQGDDSPHERFRRWMIGQSRQSTNSGAATVKVSSFGMGEGTMRHRFFLERPTEEQFEEVHEWRLLMEDRLEISTSFLVRCPDPGHGGGEWLVSFLKRGESHLRCRVV